MGGVSPNSRLYSQSYPSIYSSGVGQGGGGSEQERGALEAERDRRRSGIVDLEEACEDEDEDEEEVDERRRLGAESAGEERCRPTVLNGFFCSSPVDRASWSGVFSMDEDSVSRDCEPFFESDGEEESTDGRAPPRRVTSIASAHPSFSFFPPVSGSLSEEAPPPSRGMAMGQSAYTSRNTHPMALARSLPVSVPVWGCRGGRVAQGDSGSGERVRLSMVSGLTRHG